MAKSSVAARSKEEVFQELVDDILANRLEPGAALSERALAKRFRVSRTPIREVLLQLKREYLVDFYPNQGAFVRRLSPQDVRDLFQLREALEPLAASLAADRRDDGEVRALLVRFAEVKGEGKELVRATELAALGEQLHDAIASWSGNRFLSDIYATLRKQTRLIRSMTRTRMEVELLSFAEHMQVLEAISNRTPELAFELMLRHLQRSNRAVSELMLAH